MSDSEIHSHHHHHHEHHEHHHEHNEHHHEHNEHHESLVHHHQKKRSDSTSMFREYMINRYKRKKIIIKCTWYLLVVATLAVILGVVYAYVLDRALDVS